MKKFIVMGLLVFSGAASAEVRCVAVREAESVEVRVIDTFVNRMAYVTRVHPTLSYPVEQIAVDLEDKEDSFSFTNYDKGLVLEVDKMISEKPYPFVTKGHFAYGEIFTATDCYLQ